MPTPPLPAAMSRFVLALALLAPLALAACDTTSDEEALFVPGEVLVDLKDGVGVADFRRTSRRTRSLSGRGPSLSSFFSVSLRERRKKERRCWKRRRASSWRLPSPTTTCIRPGGRAHRCRPTPSASASSSVSRPRILCFVPPPYPQLGAAERSTVLPPRQLLARPGRRLLLNTILSTTMRLALTALLASAFLCGCELALIPLLANQTPERVETSQLSSTVYPQLDPSTPVRVTTGDLSVPYEEVAIVSVRTEGGYGSPGTIADLNQRLEVAARRVGADTVVRVDYDEVHEGDSSFSWRTATGTAVRVQELGR